MNAHETSQSIDAEAAEWVAREDRAPLSPDEQKTLETWLQGDPRRPGALLRARAVWMRSRPAQALGAQYDPARFSSKTGVSRRQWLTWGGAGAASVAAAVAAGAFFAPSGAYATKRGEIRLVPLDDGSTVMLNTETRVRVRYDDTVRRVELVEGEADFTVVSDPRRPFVVEADGQRFNTREAAFRVRRLAQAPVDVLVHRGRVDVAAREQERRIVLQSHTRLVMDEAAPHVVPAEEVTRELAWREGKIAFEGETLAEAAAAFARYSDTRIEIEDTELSREPVTGLFAANDPLGFSRAVAGLFDARVDTEGRRILLTRAVETY